MSRQELYTQLSTPSSSGIAKILALQVDSSVDLSALATLIEKQVPETLFLRPPLPWEPLAPLRQLFEHWHKELPGFTDEDLEPAACWLGPQVPQTRLFLRMAILLQKCPTWVWIRKADFQVPMWGHFLRWVAQEEWKAPIGFLYLIEPGEQPEIGTQMLSISPDCWKIEEKSRMFPGLAPKLPKRLAQYLSQALIFGDKLDRKSLQKVSKAKHKQRIKELQKAELYDHNHKLNPEKLFAQILPPPPTSQRWRKQALKLIKKGNPVGQQSMLWLQLQHPFIATSAPIQQRTLTAFSLHKGESNHGEYLHFSTKDRTDDAQLASFLSICTENAKNTEDLAHLHPEIQLLAQIQKTNGTPKELAALTRSFEKNQDQAQETNWRQALAAITFAESHLAHGQMQNIFPLLNPHKESKEWSIQWLIHRISSQLFSQVGRTELARNHLKQAIACLPHPISPILAAELRLASFRLRQPSKQMPNDLQLQLAKKTFQAAGDGIRLGKHLSLMAERHWQRRQFDEARGMFARAMALFRLYHDGMRMKEAQLKLGLVIKRAPASTLGL